MRARPITHRLGIGTHRIWMVGSTIFLGIASNAPGQPYDAPIIELLTVVFDGTATGWERTIVVAKANEAIEVPDGHTLQPIGVTTWGPYYPTIYVAEVVPVVKSKHLGT